MTFQFKTVLVTGAAGFIGFHLCRRLLEQNCTVVGIDNLNNYYDVTLKEARLKQLRTHPRFTFIKTDMADHQALMAPFKKHSFDVVVNLAAQAGVRYSVSNPHAYVQSNVVGFVNFVIKHRT